MQMPIDPLVAEILERLDENLKEAWNERSAVFQFEAGLSRAHAECLAILQVVYRHPEVLTGQS